MRDGERERERESAPTPSSDTQRSARAQSSEVLPRSPHAAQASKLAREGETERERERERQSQERPAAQQSEALRPQKCVLNSRASTTATRYPSARAISHAPVVHRSQRVLVLVLES